MKKAYMAVIILSMIICLGTGIAFAKTTINAGEERRIVVEQNQLDGLLNSDAILPVDIIQQPEIKEVRKIYELAPSVNPERLPRDSFERNGTVYHCTDILREVVIGEESQQLKQTEAVDSPKKDMDTVLNLLPESKDITTEDGFVGTLRLDISSIKAEIAGYGNSTKAVTTIRSYPNLSDADTQHIPKTINDNGKIYTLQTVNWQSNNTKNVDDYAITDRYTAIATYSGTKTTSYVKGYTISAEYVGDVYKTGVSKIRYTVIFAADTEAKPLWIIIIAVLVVLLIIVVILMIKKKPGRESEENDEEANSDNTVDSDDIDNNANDSNGQ